MTRQLSFFRILNTPLAIAIQRLSTVTSARDEDQAAGRAYHARPRRQDLADLAGLDEMGVELHRRKRRLARDEACGHAAGAIGEGHDHTALHEAAAIVVLVLGDQREFKRAVLQPFPQRADQRQESRGFGDLPAVGFEFVRGLGRHEVGSVAC
ncbi:hypothetical protein ABIF31_001245 [Bradyrhizobium elkanii]